MLFSLLKYHLDLNTTDTALKVSQSLYCFTTSISHGVENYFPRLWGTGISDAIFLITLFSQHSCTLEGEGGQPSTKVLTTYIIHSMNFFSF